MMKKILFAFVLSLSLLCAAALAEPCAICGGDRVCDACGGSGYQLMQVYNSDKQVKVACTALCANGACPVCPAPCAVCSSDGLCNTCEGNGYVHMQVYGTNMNVKIACTGENCDDGKCTACKGSISTAIVSTSTPEPSSPFADPVVEKAARASLKTGEKVTADWFEEVKALEIKKHTLSTSTFSDLEKMVNLETLHLIECGITDLNPIVDTLVNLKKLNKLNLLSNQISDLTPLARLKNLVDLAFYKNQVSDLSPLSNLTNLKYLTADYNLISDISPLAKLSKLYSADLNFNQIADVSPLKGLKTLHILSLDNNQIKDISPLRGHPELWSISLKNNQIIDFSALKSMPNLKYESISGNAEAIFRNTLIEAAVRKKTKYEGERIPYSTLQKITKLEIRGNEDIITDLSDLLMMPNLKELEIHDCLIRDLTPITKLSKLTWLSLTYCGISNLNFLQSMTNLESLWLSGNEISDISILSNLKNLDALSLDHNQISDVRALSSLKNLTFLSLDSNPIQDISPLSGLTKLNNLSIHDAQISNVKPLEKLTNLTTLSLSYNQIIDTSPLMNLSKLKTIFLDGNSTTEIIDATSSASTIVSDVPTSGFPTVPSPSVILGKTITLNEAFGMEGSYYFDYDATAVSDIYEYIDTLVGVGIFTRRKSEILEGSEYIPLDSNICDGSIVVCIYEPDRSRSAFYIGCTDMLVDE